MPDLTDDLRALLRARADDAPAVPAPTERLLRAVRLRRATRAARAVAASTLGVTGLALGALAVRVEERAVAPAAPPAQVPLTGDEYELCTTAPQYKVRVNVHPTELEFAQACYRVVAGTEEAWLFNPQSIPHDLVVSPEGGAPVLRTDPVTGTGLRTLFAQPLAAGDYELTCSLHPEMHAQLVVR